MHQIPVHGDGGHLCSCQLSLASLVVSDAVLGCVQSLTSLATGEQFLLDEVWDAVSVSFVFPVQLQSGTRGRAFCRENGRLRLVLDCGHGIDECFGAGAGRSGTRQSFGSRSRVISTPSFAVCDFLLFKDFCWSGCSLNLNLNLSYFWAQVNREQVVNFMFGLQFQAMYLPLVMILLDLAMGQFDPLTLFGMAIAHVFYFLDVVYPQQPHTQGKRPLGTPEFM